MTTAYVLGGGGVLGAHEVGMLRALSEAGIRPNVVVGTSVGAINGAFVAADPAGAAARLALLWQGEALRGAFSETVWGRALRLARSGTHLHSMDPLRQLLEDMLPGTNFADLELPFHCVAASIEHASARWFSSGPIVPAVLASCAVPGLLPAVEVDGEHFFDGGLVDSIPVGRAIALGACLPSLDRDLDFRHALGGLVRAVLEVDLRVIPGRAEPVILDPACKHLQAVHHVVHRAAVDDGRG